jgi:folate-binding protein YgfZ
MSSVEQVSPDAGYDALRASAACHVLRRDVLSVSGPDTGAYLQGQCSQDVEGLAPGVSTEALLLSPQGKVDAYVRITRRAAEEFVIDTDEGFGAVVTARLERFRLRMKVAIAPLDWICVALRGPESMDHLTGRPEAPVVTPVAWPGFSGVDLLGPVPAAGPAQWIGDEVVRCGDEAWEAARIEAGVPVNGREIVEGSIAAEVGLVERTVSFTKGCFTGQELVARLDARGSKVARRLCGVVIRGSGDPVVPGSVPVGASVLTTDTDHEVGHLSSVAWSPGSESPVALATLHRRIEPPQAVLVRWTDGDGLRTVEAESRLLPLTT